MAAERREAGQASVELVAAVPVLALAALVCLQLLATGQTLTLADGAAEAAAIALASGEDPAQAARRALPGWADDRVEVESSGGRVTVRVRPRSPIEPLAAALEVSTSAWARRPAGLR
jgi:hypothetical protein